jgi:hypothetical protein
LKSLGRLKQLLKRCCWPELGWRLWWQLQTRFNLSVRERPGSHMHLRKNHKANWKTDQQRAIVNRSPGVGCHSRLYSTLLAEILCSSRSIFTRTGWSPPTPSSPISRDQATGLYILIQNQDEKNAANRQTWEHWFVSEE